MSRLLAVTMLLCPFALASPAAAQPGAPKYEPEPDEKAFQAAVRIADPLQRADALIKLVHDFPEYPYIRNVVWDLFRNPVKSAAELNANPPADPTITAELLDKFIPATSAAPAYARAEFYTGIAKYLLDKDILLPRAVELARAAVPLLNEADYVANEKRQNDRSALNAKKRNPDAKRDPFSEEQARAHYRAFAAAVYGTLGRALVRFGDLNGAHEAFRQAYAKEPVLDAALGMADIAEKHGDAAGAVNYLIDAYLTGRMTEKQIQRLNDAWAKEHGGKQDGLQAALDARFREHLSSPLHPERYSPPANRSHRVALTEFVTGAGCEPCTAVDMAFDAALKRYSRDELVLIAYHMHAPTLDPMSNFSVEDRLKYYDIYGAPTVLLDGVQLNAGEGMKSEAPRVFGNLDDAVQKELTRPEQATISLDARLEKGNVRVTAAVKNVDAGGRDLRLQLALVENEVSYSGQNGLRFHPMVVRSLAYPGGFALGGSNPIDYTFNISRIAAENLAYYDWFIDDLYNRVQLRMSFKEKRYKVDEHNLSVVAFLQDDASKNILQAAYVKIAPERAER